MLHRPFRHARGRLADRREAGLPEAEVVALEVGCRLWILQDRLPHCELTPGLHDARAGERTLGPGLGDISGLIAALVVRGLEGQLAARVAPVGLSQSLGVGSYVSPI